MKALHYKDIGLISRHVSTLTSRSLANTEVEFCGITLKVPIVAAPMPDVCNGLMAKELGKLGGLGIIHRFQSIENQINEYKIVDTVAGNAIGITDDYFERFIELYNAGCRIFCLDTANGANKMVEHAAQKLIEKHQDISLIVGNVASAETYKWLADLKLFSAVRVGIAGGAACSTKLETGIYYPMVSSVLECVKIMQENNGPSIIADGGIKIPADMAKALAIGANVVMMGSVLAGCKESPSPVIKLDNGKHKIFRGAASYSRLAESGKKPSYVEGLETLVPYTGSLEKTVVRFKGGLQSSMSYMNAYTLEEFTKNSDWCVI